MVNLDMIRSRNQVIFQEQILNCEQCYINEKHKKGSMLITTQEPNSKFVSNKSKKFINEINCL
jgi:hypothetical protein